MNGRKFGSTRRLPSGRYQASYWHDGARHTADQTFRSDTAAGDWLIQQRADLLKGNWIDPSSGRVTVREYARTWLDGREDLEIRTSELYAQLLEQHILPTLGDLTIRELAQSPNRVRSWRANLPAAIAEREHQSAAEAKRSPRRNVTGHTAAAKAYRRLSQIMKTAVIDDLITKSPCRVKGGGKETAPERETVTLPEAQLLINAIPERMRAALLVAVWCQLRRAEILGLRRRDLDLRGETVHVRKTRVLRADGTILEKEPKSEAGKRVLAVPKHIVPILAQHVDRFVVDDPNAFLFTGVKGPATVHKHLLQFMEPGQNPHQSPRFAPA